MDVIALHSWFSQNCLSLVFSSWIWDEWRKSPTTTELHTWDHDMRAYNYKIQPQDFHVSAKLFSGLII